MDLRPGERPHDEYGAACRFVAALLDRLDQVQDEDQAEEVMAILVPLPDGGWSLLGDLTARQAAAIRARAVEARHLSHHAPKNG